MATYTIQINGWGTEMVLGAITKQAYDYWSIKDEDDSGLANHLFWDPYEAEEGNEVTDESDPRFLGNWYENDDIEHSYGAFSEKCVVIVLDEDDQEIWECDEPAIKSTSIIDPEEQEAGYYIKIWQTEKGNFFTAEIETDKFDPDKLVFYASNIDGDSVIDSVEYDGQALDTDDIDTRTKSSGWEFYENL